MTTQHSLEIGSTYNLGRGVVAKVTGEGKRSYYAEQEYKGKTLEIVIPRVCIGNPHYLIEKI